MAKAGDDANESKVEMTDEERIAQDAPRESGGKGRSRRGNDGESDASDNQAPTAGGEAGAPAVALSASTGSSTGSGTGSSTGSSTAGGTGSGMGGSSQAAEQLAGDVQDLQADMTQMAQERRAQVEAMVRERPLVMLLGAFAIGYIIGKLR